MSFEQGPQEIEQSAPEEAVEKEEVVDNSIYEKARKWSNFFLKGFDFTKEEDVIEIKPEKLEEETPVFFSPGWGVTGTSKAIMEAISERGRNVISTFYTREEKIKKEDIPGAELQKAFAIIEIISKKDIDKIDAIGHSEGGLALALAASIRPDLFRNIVLIAPAGMMENDSFWGLVGKFAIKEPLEEIRGGKMNIKTFISYLKDISIHALSNPVISVKEIQAMNQMNLFEITKYLKSQGVGVGLVCGANDEVFPMEEVLKNVGKDNVDHFLSTRGNHGSIVLGNDYKEYVELAETLLKKMSEKEK